MKAAPFEFARAESLAEVCARLAEHGAEAKLIAGGQSLVPMMAMRLARPAWLVDVNHVPELQGIAAGPDAVEVGAAVRQAALERDPGIRVSLPLLGRALKWVGHLQTRNRGTVGGSIAHADPSAEIPLVACVLDAMLMLHDAADGSEMAAREFFLAPMVSAITPEQCLASIRFPVWADPRVGCAFEEVSIRHGDFALASACAQLALDHDGRCVRAVLGVGGATPVPQALPEVAEQLLGSTLGEQLIRESAAAAADGLEIDSDLHGSTDYRRQLARTLLERVLRSAHREALDGARMAA